MLCSSSRDSRIDQSLSCMNRESRDDKVKKTWTGLDRLSAEQKSGSRGGEPDPRTTPECQDGRRFDGFRRHK
jgi:hypothetical protein